MQTGRSIQEFQLSLFICSEDKIFTHERSHRLRQKTPHQQNKKSHTRKVSKKKSIVNSQAAEMACSNQEVSSRLI